MMNPNANGENSLSPAILDAVKASVDKTYASLCGAKPTLSDDGEVGENSPRIAGIISFLGTTPWTFSWILTEEAAPAIAQKFTGFEIPFDSSDMGDMASELVNVIAGEIVAQLEKRGIKAQMSLPTVLRGAPLELMPETGPTVARLDYTANEGPFSIRVASANSAKTLRMPGKQLVGAS
jgi:chemotaxis protein CheX